MKRELNEIEFLIWTMGQPCNVVLSCRIYGDISPEQLRSALLEAQQRHPLLKVNITCDDSGIPWFTSDGVLAIPLVVIPRDGDQHASRIAEMELPKPFPINDAGLSSLPPLIRVTLLRSSDLADQPSDIIICIHHVIGDALSLFILIRDLLQIISNPEQPLETLDITAANDNVLPASVQKKVPVTERRFKLLFNFLKFYHKLKVRSKKRIRVMADCSFKVDSWQLPKELTGDILTRCKQRNIGLQAAICSAFSPLTPNITIPVGLRNRLALPIGEEFGLFASGLHIEMKYDPKRDFWDNARRFQKRLYIALEKGKMFSMYTIINKFIPLQSIQHFWEILLDISSKKREFVLSNLGSLDNLGINFVTGNYRVASLVVSSSATLVDAVVIIFFTLNGKLHFQSMYNERTTTAEEVTKMVDFGMNHLREVVNLVD